VQAALPLSKEERPGSVEDWWDLRSTPSEVTPPSGRIELPPAETEIEAPVGVEPEPVSEKMEPAMDIPETPAEKPEPDAKKIEAEPTAATGPICSNCRHKNRPGTRFCEQCGTPLLDERVKCWHCSYLNRPGVKFCENCAGALAKPDTACPRCGYSNRPSVKFCENCAAPLAQK